MKTDPDREGARLWAVVTSTIRPFHGVVAVPPSRMPLGGPRPPVAPSSHTIHSAKTPNTPNTQITSVPPIEPSRRRGLEKSIRSAGPALDLHGHDYETARALLTRIILARHAEGSRSILVVTGKGALGQGVLRRHLPQWLAQPPLRAVVAGVSEAHRRHGGEGAFYVALKRRARI